MMSSAGRSGLILAGSPPISSMASRIAARSTTAGTPVKSCISTRAGVYAISLEGSSFATHLATFSTSSAVTDSPSSKRSRFSSRILIEYGRRPPSYFSWRASRRKISCFSPPASRVAFAPKLSGCAMPWKISGMAAPSLYDLACVVHLHSTFSDGTGTVPQIIAAGQRAGVDVVLLTDHNTRAGASFEGWHGSTLLLVGEEDTPGRSDHTLVLGSSRF